MFERVRKAIVTLVAPARQKRVTVKKEKVVRKPPMMLSRTYGMAKQSRLMSGWGTSTTSEDSELVMSLRTARNRSRELVRDAAYAKRAKVIVQNNVVGSGIGLQAKLMTTRGALNDRLNNGIEAAWERWSYADSCHTGRSMHFCDLERAAMGQVFEAGEVFIRLHRRPFGESAVPLALELIEAERLADEFQPGPSVPSAGVRMGVEVDSFCAPIAYWIRTLHPGEVRLTAEQTVKIERVPAEDILHLRLIDRWPQTRGIPWMHAAARKLNDMDGLTEAEIEAARGAACYMATIESPDGDTSFEGPPQADGTREIQLAPAVVERLSPGEKLNFVAPNRPNTALDPFMRMMLREVAAGVGCSYESLSRDYSQSNYSSSRLSLLDDRDLWRMLQLWFIRSFRMPLHRVWLQQAVLARAIPSIAVADYALEPEKFEAVRFKPRGWSWVDPTKEIESAKAAIEAGFTTVTAVIAQTADGRDIEDVMNERKQELAMMEQMGLTFNSDPSFVNPADEPAPAPAPTAEPPDDGTDPDVERAESFLRGQP